MVVVVVAARQDKLVGGTLEVGTVVPYLRYVSYVLHGQIDFGDAETAYYSSETI